MQTRGGARPGAGRPAGIVADKNINIRIPAVELKNARAAAARDDMRFSEWVREAIRRML